VDAIAQCQLTQNCQFGLVGSWGTAELHHIETGMAYGQKRGGLRDDRTQRALHGRGRVAEECCRFDCVELIDSPKRSVPNNLGVDNPHYGW
jgi:hypothetical protein